MKVGTKSVLFGAHQFLIHPIIVARAWSRLYGFPIDHRLWVAFFVHDVGYIGKPNMDGDEGETHVETGAKIMGKLFGKEWHDFTLNHSRFYAKKNNTKISRLCVADKYAMVLTPTWLFVALTTLSGERSEYFSHEKYKDLSKDSYHAWYEDAKKYFVKWVDENKEIE